MKYAHIELERDERGVARLTFARPALFNALSVDMMREIHDALDRLHADNELRVLILSGQGEMFCAGGDINMFKAMGAAPAEERLQGAFRGTMLGARIANLPVPVVGRINGPAYGGGVGMVAACDIAVGSDTCRFAFTEMKRGVAPTAALPPLLMRVGPAVYKRYLFSGRRFDAVIAKAIGLLDEVVPSAELDAAVDREVADVLTGAPGAIRATKAAVDRIVRHGPDSVGIDGLYSFAEGWASEEGREGSASFLEKRKPYWDRGTE